MKLSELAIKKTAIWGYGVEGQATAIYLNEKGIGFTVLCKNTEAVDEFDCDTATVDLALLNNFDVVIKSPGISSYSDLVKQTTAEMTSPTAIWFTNEKNTHVIAVTGTKGKSTIVSLLAHILKSSGKSVNLVGNIGQALISSSSNYDYIILEASSFQIYDGNIQADIVLINNLFAEHVDWHNGEDNYFKDKLKILTLAKTKIINAKNEQLNKLVNDEGVCYFNINDGFHVRDEALMFKDKKILSLSEIQLIGTHNLENIGAALSVCLQLSLDLNTCIDAVKSFKPLAHRLQNLGKIGLHYAINDSIATTPIATLAAMQTVDLNKTTLLIGGYDRGNDWTKFAESINNNPPSLLVISGQNSEAIFDHLEHIKAQFKFKLCKNLSKAINYAKLNSPTNHTILLSPGAPSFDQFDSYIKRGEFFIEVLRSLE